ncbi:MAG: putative peptidoglycan glycosyltransferase FtsW [Bacillota bacterium]|nr:putative peptidoglycan glycosyltransferase FtsW [Bacillota bacterium]
MPERNNYSLHSGSSVQNSQGRTVNRRLPQTPPQSAFSGKVSKRLSKTQMRFKMFSIRLGLDLPFCLLVLILVTIGLIMMFSASAPVSYYTTGDSYYYLKRQLIFAVFGIIAMIAISYFDYHFFHKLAMPILGLSFILLIAVLFWPGNSEVKRWINLGQFTFQASEFTKFALILFFAHWGAKYFDKTSTFRYGVFPALAVLVPTVGLLALEPHFSGIVIMTLLTAVMMYLYGTKLRWFVMALAGVLVVFFVLLITNKLGYAMERMDGWGQALTYTTNQMWQTTWQTRNSLYAIGSGGFWGLGLGQSRQKFLFLPEPQNDFVFAIVVEELGFIGAIIILGVFGLLVWRGITMSMRAKDKFGALLGMGLTAQVGLQVVLNIFVITDFLPNTGISLPFFSSGGSSLLMLLVQMGIILSISRNANIEKT